MNGTQLKNKNKTSLGISLIFLLCTTTLVAFGLGSHWITTNGSTVLHSPLTKNTESDMESPINQCVTAYYYYPTSIYQGVDLHHLHKLCQTLLKEKTQLKPTENSTTKTKQPLPVGKSEENQSGGTKSTQTMNRG